MDTVDDIIDDSATNLKSFAEVTGNETPMLSYFTPEDMTIFSLFMGHFFKFFKGLMPWVAYISILVLAHYSRKVEVMNAAIAILIMIVTFSSILAYNQGVYYGRF